VPQVVPESALANAVAWNSSGWQVASVIGPALGGFLLEGIGRAVGACLLVAGCALTCLTLVAWIQVHAPPRQREPVTLASFLAGVRFVWKTELILATITLDLFAVLLGGATALMPQFQSILKTDAVGYGCLQAAPAIGALLMAVYLAHRPPLRRAGRALLWSVAGFGAATIGFGLSEHLPLSLLLLALLGAFDNVSMVVRGTLVQVLTPDEMRGRVSAVNAVFIGSSNELGAFESGVTAEAFGPVASVVGGGIGTILVVLTVMLKWPAVMRLGALHTAGQELKCADAPAAVAAGEQTPPVP
jgi:MFS family permease